MDAKNEYKKKTKNKTKQEEKKKQPFCWKKKHAIQSAAEINSFLPLAPLLSRLRRIGGEEKLKSWIFTSIFLNKAHHLARQREKTASPNEVPMYSFTSLQQEERRYEEKR